VIPNLTAI